MEKITGRRNEKRYYNSKYCCPNLYAIFVKDGLFSEKMKWYCTSSHKYVDWGYTENVCRGCEHETCSAYDGRIHACDL